MKILIYSPKFYPSIGGLENLTLMLAKEFLQQGHQVKVVCFEAGNGVSCGVETYYSPSVIQQVQLYWWSNVFYMPNISLKGLWLRLLNPFKNWVISHNGWYGPFVDGHQKGLNERVKLFLLRFAKNISVSMAVANYIPVKSTVIANCYDEAVFHTNYLVNRESNVLFVGRMVSDKGIDILVHACMAVWKKGFNFKLNIVGSGEMEQWVNEIVEQNNLQEKVVLKGKLAGQQLAEEMNRNKIMAVPSTWQEPFGIVALEGLACGCNVICSSGGGLPEAVGEFGSLFDNGNIEKLSQQIEFNLTNQYCPNPEAIAAFLKKHNPSIVAEKYIDVFNTKKH